MAGTRIEVTVEDAEVKRRLNELLRVVKDPTPFLRDVGEYLLRSWDKRFDTETDPTGKKWEPWSKPWAKKRLEHSLKRTAKKKVVSITARPRILTLEGHLRRLAYEVDRDQVEVGSNQDHAATHQFGRGGIPARPFLGLSTEDEKEVGELAAEHLKKALGDH